MPSEFSRVGKSAIDAIPVPSLSMDAVRARASQPQSRGVLRRILLIAALTIGGVGAALAAVKTSGISLWINGNKAAVEIHSMEMIRGPRKAEFESAVTGATFSVTYPVGLPKDAKIVRLMVSPKGHPTSVTVEYQGAHFHAGFFLADRSIVNADSKDTLHPKFGNAQTWQVGNEVVVVPSAALSADELQNIQAAMKASTPDASKADAESRLLNLMAIGGCCARLELPERYASSDGRSVLLDDSYVHNLPSRITRKDLILDNRIQTISGIPYKDGVPQFNSMHHITWSKGIVIDLAGMRAMQQMLQAHGLSQCRCYALYHRDSNGYTLWVFPPGDGKGRKFTLRAT